MGRGEMRGRKKWVRREMEEMEEMGLKMSKSERERRGRLGRREREREGRIEDERKIKGLQERKETVVVCKHSG